MSSLYLELFTMALQGVLMTSCHSAQSLLLTQGLGHERYLLDWNRKIYTQYVDKDVN
jgi:hypothetical protein